MPYFPICLDIENRTCIVIGGGHVAARKVKGLLIHGARVRVISPELVEELATLVEQGDVGWEQRPYRQGDLADAFLVIAATDDPEVQERVHGEADERNTLLNVADVPKWCNFILPATSRLGDLSISVSTAGKSPALARKLRERFDDEFGQEFNVLVNLLGNLRATVLDMGKSHKENKELFGRLAQLEVADWIRAGEWQKVENHINETLGVMVPPEIIAAAQDEYADWRRGAGK